MRYNIRSSAVAVCGLSMQAFFITAWAVAVPASLPTAAVAARADDGPPPPSFILQSAVYTPPRNHNGNNLEISFRGNWTTAADIKCSIQIGGIGGHFDPLAKSSCAEMLCIDQGNMEEAKDVLAQLIQLRASDGRPASVTTWSALLGVINSPPAQTNLSFPLWTPAQQSAYYPEPVDTLPRYFNTETTLTSNSNLTFVSDDDCPSRQILPLEGPPPQI